MRRPRRNHSPAFKAKVALEAVKGEKTIAIRELMNPPALKRRPIGFTANINEKR